MSQSSSRNSSFSSIKSAGLTIDTNMSVHHRYRADGSPRTARKVSFAIPEKKPSKKLFVAPRNLNFTRFEFGAGMGSKMAARLRSRD